MAPEPRTESEKGPLEEIRREVIESRNLVIKTDNLLKNLHAELKMVGKRQEEGQKRQWVATGVAYALFVVLCVGGAAGISLARSSSASAERERLEKDLAEARTQLDTQKAEQAAEEKAQRSAADLLRKLSSASPEERLEAAESVAKLEGSRLSGLERQALTDRAAGVRKEAAAASLERGRAAYRRAEFAAAAKDLSRAMAMNPSDSETLETSFMLGSSLAQIRKPEEAIPHLKRFVTEDRRAKTRDVAMLLLAQSYDQTSQFEKAAETAREALATYPNSEYVPQLKNRLSAAKRGMGGTTVEPVAPPPAAPAAPIGAAPVPAVRQPLRPAAAPAPSGVVPAAVLAPPAPKAPGQ